MTPAQSFNEEQRTRWGGADGEYWASHQERLDRVLQPVLQPLVEFAAPVPGSTVIDIGCGCGATTLELARAVGSAGRVVGLDLSGPMIAVAKERLRTFPHTTFLHGDAAELPLKGIDAELMVSRFGVMFFGDPVAAFSNIRTGLAAGGRLRFACWRPINENPWLQVPLHAVYEHVPRLPKPGPEEPGPFSFADPARVTRILTSAGFSAPSFTPLDMRMELGASLEEAVAQSTEMGPAKRAMADQPEEVCAAARESVRRALKAHTSPSGVELAAAVWLVAAARL
jgi:SAM-dependent methyltransferase